jgi:hypothetical protein
MPVRQPLAGPGGAALHALTQMAFPLLLALFVVAFLVVQSRIDRNDPKLAGAPVDDDDQFLSFT